MNKYKELIVLWRERAKKALTIARKDKTSDTNYVLFMAREEIYRKCADELEDEK